MKIVISYRRADSCYLIGRVRDWPVAAFGDQSIFRDLNDFLSWVDFRAVLETETNDFECFDMVGNFWQCMGTLGGENHAQPDGKYSYPWKDDQRNDIRANPQIRRVVRGSSRKDAIGALRCSSRSGQIPEDPGLPGMRHGFRVAINL